MEADRPDPESGSTSGSPSARSSLLRRLGFYAAALLVAFLAGFLPMWNSARVRTRERDDAETAARVSRIQNVLANAAIDARRGEYESARQSASAFFTELRSEIDRGPGSSFSQAQLEGLRPLLAGRDDMITLLARSDPASADRLLELYVMYRAEGLDAPPR